MPGNMSNTVMQFLPIILIVVVFYFLLIRPQQKAEKKRKEMINLLKKGDRVLTHSGIYATVADRKGDDRLVLRIADGVKVEFTKAAISKKIEKSEESSSGI